ncbi:MAG: methyltransferase domain-containing protein [candidate division KSB1 bacterium]|nr:methyltransferase domain-containing protein [candidate division KSB1 bacterium]
MTKANETLWRYYEEYGEARGRLAVALLSSTANIRGAKVLDFGAGTGGASLAAAQQGAQVFAVEIDAQKRAALARRTSGYSVQLFENLEDAVSAAGYFEAVILADVLEHLSDAERLLSSLARCLSPRGVIFLSTPNRCSPINLLCDPHYSLPLLSLLKRENVRRMAVLFAGAPRDKSDWPELLSLNQLERLAKEAGFSLRLVHRQAVRYGLLHPQALWNRPVHLKIILGLKHLRLERLLLALISDAPNLWNRFMMPTFYLLMQKRPAGDSDRP